MNNTSDMKPQTLYVFLALALAGAWQALHWMIGGDALASPAQAVTTLVALMQTGDFWSHTLETAKALIYALAIGLVGGLAAGLLLGVNRLARDVAEPILLNVYAIPKVTLYPLVLLVFGLGLSAKVAFGVMHGIIPIMVFTMNAIRQMRPVLLRAGQSMRLTRRQSILHIVLPAILPEIAVGLRLAFSLTLLGVLIGEMFASQRGLGFLLTNAMNLGDMRTIMAVALLLTTFALGCNAGLMRLGRRLSPR
ncbi:ABC transporter permease subunit [Herbaspirillum lusitanum]|jgi:NitT/TauT family transport system permease protein|uniref:ABC transporter permease subunit n=1 Tax=Herbaspirillum lusitanum TaxID=213312 RepID=A0ABW9AHR6_9BURK